MKGTIKKIFYEKGFGFITPDGGAKDVFFHVNDLAEGLDFESLKTDDVVTFEMGTSAKGPKAENIALVE